jgi:hypothetical protein
MSLREFMEAWAAVPSHIWNGCVTIWATPLWWKIETIIYLVTLFGGMWFSIDSMITWMDALSDNAEYVYDPLHELIFWGWMFGTIAGMFLYRVIFISVSTKILLLLGCIDENEII